jgi:non-ribosomal peptide synthetase component F
MNASARGRFDLSAKQRQLLDHLLAREFTETRAPERIERRRDDGAAPPLSFAQERLWFLDRLQAGNAAYNVPVSFRMAGVIDVAALERSLIELVRRHEALRTSFMVVDGRPVQVVAPRGEVALAVEELGGAAAAEREAEAQRRAAAEALRPFDLGRGPLLRARLLRLSPSDHVLLLTLHHIVADGWSMGVLVRELGALYGAFAAGRPSPLAELALQYADFAVWQRQWLQGAVLEGLLGYWRAQLAGAPLLLELPSDRPRPAVQSFRGAVQAVQLPAAVVAALKALGHGAGATLFMVLLAAFKVLLFRYSSQADVVVGTPIANRTRPELEGLIGFFVNTLVLRSRLHGTMSFRALLSQLRETTLGAYAHQDLPFERLVEELRPERHLSHNPLFQVMFVLQNMPGSGGTAADAAAAAAAPPPGPAQPGTAKFDLSLALAESADGIAGAFEYNTDLFDAATIARMAGHFRHLLDAIVAEPDLPIGRLALLSAAERRQILHDWNDTAAAPAAAATTVPELFAAQAALTPQATAVSWHGGSLSYGELNRRANRLAHLLRRRGVGPEVRVALYFASKVDLIVALMATLQAGGANLILDPETAPDDLARMAAGAKVVLTQAEFRDRFAGLIGIGILIEPRSDDHGDDTANVPVQPAHPAQLACVLHNADRKATLISHQALCDYCHDLQQRYGLGPDDRVMPFPFTGSKMSIGLTLASFIAGATVVICSDAKASPMRLYDTLAEQSVTVLSVPTTYWQLAACSWAAQASVLAPIPLKLVSVSGDRMPAAALDNWRKGPLGGARLVRHHSPGEALSGATCFDIPASLVPERIPIGRPLPNFKLYIIDAAGQVAPIGVAGEIYIGGTLARGYLDQPAATAESFVPDPFAAEPGARLYRTGHRARRLIDGNVEWLGYMAARYAGSGVAHGGAAAQDVEAALLQHPLIAAALVLRREQSAAPMQLVAYLVARHASALPLSTLTNFLGTRIPKYMMPSEFIWLDALPTRADGEIDYVALTAIYGTQRDSPQRFAAADGPVERVIADIWTYVLAVERVGANDNFFEIGGHSLLATLVTARLCDLFGVDFPLQQIFAHPVLSDLAAALINIDPGKIERTAEILLQVTKLSELEVEDIVANRL